MSLVYALLGVLALAAAFFRWRRAAGSVRGTERRRPGENKRETLEERRKDDDVGGEA